MQDFNRRVGNTNDLNQVGMLSLSGELSSEDQERLHKLREFWNFYDGFHWEDIPQDEKPQITENYCRKFVTRYVAFEMGSAFTVSVPSEIDEEDKKAPTPITDFLNEVWKANDKAQLCIDLGQVKSITGDGWIQVKYVSADKLNDPFGEYPKGRIRTIVIPTGIVFPVYNPHDKDELLSLTIAYPIEVTEVSPILRKQKVKKVVYKQFWSKDRIHITEGATVIADIPNPYKVIPFVQIKNLSVVGREQGLSDLEDLIPLNMELNLKKSDVSEIIDYHSAPVTVIFGAKVSGLEKGANKIWGGLPKDAKVQNLELNGDLSASVNYIANLKSEMHDIGGLPENATAISNTSGVALQITNMPLIEKTLLKRICSTKGIEAVNKLILYIGVQEKLIEIPEGITPKEFYTSEVKFSSNLPKDMLLELQAIQLEMQMGVEDRKGALKRLNKDNANDILARVDAESEEHPEYYGKANKEDTSINSGFTNSPTPSTDINKSANGQNTK
jgi:hypothetical protein